MSNSSDAIPEEGKAQATTVSITGGTGFIGRCLLSALANVPDLELRGLTRFKEGGQLLKAPNIEWFRGGLEDIETLRDFLAAGGVLIHLAYPPDWDSSRHLAAAEKLARIAADVGVRRVVLCSTAVVVGNAKSRCITEETMCSPVGDYERTKLGIEQVFAAAAKDAYQLAVLRPTAVLGTGGRNLHKLAHDLTEGSRIVNYLRSSVFGNRTMNLVCVENVVAALVFLVRREQNLDHEVYISSDDDDPRNNFRDIEMALMTHLGLPDYAVPPLVLPHHLLSVILHLSGRSCTDPKRTYDGSRLRRAGYENASTIAQSLERFADSFKRSK